MQFAPESVSATPSSENGISQCHSHSTCQSVSATPQQREICARSRVSKKCPESVPGLSKHSGTLSGHFFDTLERGVRRDPPTPPELRKPRQLQSRFGPFGPETPKESKMSQKRVSQALWSQGSKKSKKSPKRVKNESKRVIFDSFRTLFGLFGPLGPEGLGDSFFDSFLTLLGFRARRARNGSVAGGGFLNPRDTPGTLWARRARETPVAGRGSQPLYTRRALSLSPSQDICKAYLQHLLRLF